METIGQIFGFNLRAIRRAADLTQEQLAERAEVSVAAIRNYEAGRMPEAPIVARLARALSVLEVRFIETPGGAGSPREALRILTELVAQTEKKTLTGKNEDSVLARRVGWDTLNSVPT